MTGAPLRILIGFSRRSASDDLVRCILPAMTAALGRPVDVELMPGDLGGLAVKAARSSAPDGNTVLVATFGTHAINPNLSKDLDYDPRTDLLPICLATRSPLVLGCRLSLEARQVPALIALARHRTLTYCSSGIGSAPYLAGVMFQKMAGITMVHRPYGDTRALYDDLQAGTLDMSFNNASTMLPLIRLEKVRALAVTTAQRSGVLPDLPTVAESGLEGYALNNWLGFVAPVGTPAAIVARLNAAVVAALHDAGNQAALNRDGIEVVGSTPAAFADHIGAEVERWAWLRNL